MTLEPRSRSSALRCEADEDVGMAAFVRLAPASKIEAAQLGWIELAVGNRLADIGFEERKRLCASIF